MPAHQRFRNRQDAGRRLAGLLARYREERPVVLGIPRGGVPVAAEIARALDAPLDVIVARKLGAPSNPEYGIGAIAEGGARVISQQALARLHIGPAELTALVARTEGEMAALVARLRDGRPPLPVRGRTVILVDDGLATGRTARAAAASLRARGAARVVLAAPVAAASSAMELRGSVDELVCEQMPDDLWAIGFWYEDFSPTSEADVARLLSHTREVRQAKPAAEAQEAKPAGEARKVIVEAGSGVSLPGELTLPAHAVGVVAFAHGSGSSRASPRNRAVARALNEAGLATLLLDLLTPLEERERTGVFDIPLLARRLIAAVRFLGQLIDTRELPLGCFGASTGAAAALLAAAELPGRVRAVVSRGGRPDLALERLADVRAPTLLIVGGEDRQVLELNRLAQERLRCVQRLAVIPGATHLFEEPGALDRVAQLAAQWLIAHLPARPTG
jgi:predicted phosphoribosyltransferase/pimeloyl-ACP methyl ester carboxylesterase